MRVSVLGAGPAGLAAAHYLASREIPVTVLELNDYHLGWSGLGPLTSNFDL